jgi:FKBP-type peptidyl-prolyl cis-trans isomerase/DinB superfamily
MRAQLGDKLPPYTRLSRLPSTDSNSEHLRAAPAVLAHAIRNAIGLPLASYIGSLTLVQRRTFPLVGLLAIQSTMRSLAVCSFMLASLCAQSFNPHLPAPVPPVDGAVQESPKVHFIDVRTGSGPMAGASQRYSLLYTGWLRDGKKFSAVMDPKEPFVFVPGRRQVIAGFELGFDGMRVGGKRRVFLPYQLAYGVRGNPPGVPPRAELIFDIELLSVEDVADELAAADLLLTLSDYQDKVMALTKAVPDDKYDWRPAPGMRSFREVLQAIIAGNQGLLAIATSAPPQPAATLAESFSAVRKAMESARGGTLIHETSLSGKTTTQRGVFIALEANMAECLGEATVYARLIGLERK